MQDSLRHRTFPLSSTHLYMWQILIYIYYIYILLSVLSLRVLTHDIQVLFSLQKFQLPFIEKLVLTCLSFFLSFIFVRPFPSEISRMLFGTSFPVKTNARVFYIFLLQRKKTIESAYLLVQACSIRNLNMVVSDRNRPFC